MAENHSICLLTVMDRLWYHQIILFSSDSTTSSSSSTLALESEALDSSLHLPNNSTLNVQQQQQTLSHEIPITRHYSEEEEPEERLTRMNPLSTTPTSTHRRSHSSSIVERRPPPGHIRRSSSSSMREREIGKYLSCRSFRELEMEELKGLMDLGFIFNTENVSPRMASVVPGLHRLGLHNYNIKFLESPDSEKFSCEEEEDHEEDQDSDIVRDYDEEEEKGFMRPYLSEAWLIKKPNSPLLNNITLPRGNSADFDMKKQLKFWARTVATVIQQES